MEKLECFLLQQILASALKYPLFWTLAVFAYNSRTVYIELNTLFRKFPERLFSYSEETSLCRLEWMVVAGRVWVGDKLFLCLLQLLVASETRHGHKQVVGSKRGLMMVWGGPLRGGETRVCFGRINTNPHSTGTISICLLYLVSGTPLRYSNHNVSVSAFLFTPGLGTCSVVG